MNSLNIFLHFFGKLFLKCQLRESYDCIHRCADFMGHIGKKCCLRLVSTLRIPDCLFQLCNVFLSFRQIRYRNNITDYIIVIVMNFTDCKVTGKIIFFTESIQFLMRSIKPKHIKLTDCKQIINSGILFFISMHPEKIMGHIIDDLKIIIIIIYQNRNRQRGIDIIGHIPNGNPRSVRKVKCSL